MNKISTVGTSDKTKTSIILYGRLEVKDSPIFAVGFCLKEGNTGNPVVTDQVVGLINGDVPACKFGSTVINLKENTSYRYRAVGADMTKPTYIITPDFPGVSIVSDDRGLAEGTTSLWIDYDAITKHVMVNHVWDIDFSPGGVIKLIIPPEMGGDGTASITYNIDLALIPTENFSGQVDINKIPVNIFYGATKSFKTNR